MGRKQEKRGKRGRIQPYGLWLVFLLIFPASAGLCGYSTDKESLKGRTDHRVYFKDTEYELNVYRIYGTEKGKTLMIIGGIQGDEPGGYLSADLYADMALRKGNLIVVPRANFLSIIEHKRAINWDMNRRFAPINSREYYEDKIVEILKGLMSQSDYLLNLHEGSGFFRETWENDLKNPMRFGQSIIADADIYRAKKIGATIQLGDIAKKIADRVNENIDNREHHFRFNNHRTFEKNTSHPEQRKSATFYALSTHEIPAFGIETSKEIKDIETKVRFQTMVINSFMDEFGIIPENPKVALDTPKLKYLVLSLNDSRNIVAKDGDEIAVKKGDRLKVSQIEANYERGLSIDILGLGNANDLNKEFEITSPTKAIIRKDGYKCGEVSISVSESPLHSPANEEAIRTGFQPSKKSPRFAYLIVEVNGSRQILSNGEHLKIIRGDIIKLLEVIAEGVNPKDLTVNFLGFVSNKIKNTGEDRGYPINTAKDLWIKYSKDGKGLRYPIAIHSMNNKIGELFVDIEEPKLNYIVVKHSQGEQRWYANGDTIFASAKDTIEVIDVNTNVHGNIGVKINVSGGRSGDENKILIFNKKLLKDNSIKREEDSSAIVVTREGMVIGKTKIQIGEALTLGR